jgi:hypothetical protein
LIAVALLAVASMLPGFHEAPALEHPASFVAGKPAHVYCADSFQSWGEALKSVYGPGVYPTAFTTYPGSDESYIGPGFDCAVPLAAAAGKKVDVAVLGAKLLQLVHEAIHQRGEADEGKTECAALHEMPRVAVKFFHVKPGKQLRALMAAAWGDHRRRPPAYQSVC